MSAPLGGDDLAAILDHVAEGIIVRDAAGRLIFANAAATQVLGFASPAELLAARPDEILGRFEIFGEDGAPYSAARLPGRRALTGEEEPAVPLRFRVRATGAERWAWVRARPIRDESGAVQFAVSIWSDISDRRRAEDRDRALAAIVTTSDDAIVTKLLDATVTSWNPAAERLFGWSAVEMIGQSISRIVPPERRGELDEILVRIGRGERIDHHETQRITKDGRRVDLSVSISPIVDAQGKVVGASKIARDVTTRRQTEAALTRSRLLLEEAQRIAGIGSWEWDITTDTVVWTDELFRIFGLPSRETPLTATEFRQRVHPDDRARHLAAVEGTLANHEPFVVEHRIVRPDGTVRWVQGRGRVELVGGVPVRLLGSAQDVTDAYHADERRRLLAEASAVLAESLDYTATLQRVVALAAAGFADWCAMFVRAEDGTTRRIEADYADPRKVALAAELERLPHHPNASVGVARVFRSGQAELYADLPAGFWAEISPDLRHIALREALGIRSLMFVPVRARGQIHGVLSFASAESGRRYDKEDLAFAEQFADRAALAIDTARLYRDAQAAEARYRAVFDGVAEAIVVLDEDGRFHDANPGVARLLLLSSHELLRSSLREITVDPAVAAAGLARLFAAGDWQGEIRLLRSDGATRDIEIWARRLDRPTGSVAVAVMRDVTDRHAADALREEVVAAVSHDLKNPLGGVKANAQLLLRSLRRGGPLDQERLERGLKAIDAGVGKMVVLIDDLVDAARLRAGATLELETAPTDLVDLARRAVEQYHATTPGHELLFRPEVAELGGEWDLLRLERVVGNLLTNAIKYSPRGGAIIVRVAREEHDHRAWAIFAVSDQGIGIPAADLPRVFDRFHRGSNVSGIAGTGLGLAGVAQIIDQHGGTVEVASEEAQGSTFTVKLPLAPPESI